VLKVDDLSNIGNLEKMLTNGKLTIVLIYADWCGACTRFKKSIWGPMSRMPAVHNRIAIREDLVGKTRLAGSKYTYLPTIMVVDEQGQPQAVEGPQGRTNAIPTPRTLDEMKRIVNLKVGPAAAEAAEPLPTQEPMTMQMAEKPKKTPEGIVYTPYPPALPVTGKQTGGGLLQALEIVANAAAPAAILGAGVLMGRRSTKRRRSSK
jgi:thiol-disulfide isomerase/thioredoxin